MLQIRDSSNDKMAVEELEAEVGVEKNAYMTPTAMADDAKADDAKRRFRFSGSLTYWRNDFASNLGMVDGGLVAFLFFETAIQGDSLITIVPTFH